MGGIFQPMRGPWQRTRENYRVVKAALDLRSFSRLRRSAAMVRPMLTLKDHTMLSAARLTTLYELVGSITAGNVPGDIVECGVAFGGSAAIMAHSLHRHDVRRTVWLLDSFEGLPPPTEEDGESAAARYYVGWCKGDAGVAVAMLERFGVTATDIKVVPGWFEDTVPAVAIDRIAILHIDADMFASVRVCLDVLYDRISSGGYLVVDDYGSWPGCRRAVDEFFQRRAILPELQWIDSDAVLHVVGVPNGGTMA